MIEGLWRMDAVQCICDARPVRASRKVGGVSRF